MRTKFSLAAKLMKYKLLILWCLPLLVFSVRPTVNVLAQTPVGMGPVQTSGIRSTPGLVTVVDWFRQVTQGSAVQGDFHYFTAWLQNALGLPVTSGLPIVGTLNDFSFGCSGNVGVMQLDTFSFASPAASHMTIVNCLASFNNDAVTNWKGHMTSNDNNGSGTWKNRLPFSKNGMLCIPFERQISGGTATVHDATFVCSPDSGAHWCNPYTWAHRAGSPGCDSSNWQADGDAPKCDAPDGTHPCTNAAYLDATHSSMMWHEIDNVGGASNGAENWIWINYGNQDGVSPPSGAGVESGCDPASVTCFMLTPGDGALGHVANGSVMDISAWTYSYCPGATQSTHCSGTSADAWTSTFANRTSVIGIYLTGTGQPFNGPHLNPQSVLWFNDHKEYCVLGQQVDFACSPTLQGTWVTGMRFWPAWPVGHLTAWLAPALGYSTISSSPPHVQVAAVGTQYFNTVPGTPVFAKWDLVAGRTYNGDAFQSNQLYPNGDQGAGFQFSTGNIAGSFPRKGLVWSFDFADQIGATNWFGFRDRGGNSAVITPCANNYGNTPVCGQVNGAAGTSLVSTGGIRITYGDTSTTGHFQVAPADFALNSPLSNSITPASMQGNGSYSAVGVIKFPSSDPLTPFTRYGSIWATGSNGGDDAQSQVSLDGLPVGGKQQLQLNWGAWNTKHWQFIANRTLDLDTEYFYILTVKAQTSCGTGCVPVAHLWVGINGVLTDLFAGVSYTAAGGASTSAKTPAVTNGPFVFGLGSYGAASQISVMQEVFMLYGRDLQFQEISATYKNMARKMAPRGVVIALVPMSFASTNTQIAVAYTAPDPAVCLVEASESPTYSPLAHDVDTTIFANSNRDDRTDGGISNGTRRVFVVGKRIYEAGTGGTFSRALRAFTRYYFRVTCGTVVMTGQADTLNIPLNSTYQDQPQLDRSNPGSSVTVTLPTTRGSYWIEPQIGSRRERVSLDTDIPFDSGNPATFGPFLYDSGAPRVCSTGLVGPGPGQLCRFPQGDGGADLFYYHVPSAPTPELKWLYLGRQGGIGGLNQSDGKFYSGTGNNVVVQEYNGTYASGSLSFTSGTTIVSDLRAAIAAFAPALDLTPFSGFGWVTAVGDQLILIANKNGGDSYGLLGSLKISTASVTSMMRVDEACPWCALHQAVAMCFDLPCMQIITHDFVDGAIGKGPYIVRLTADITDGTSTTIHVDGEPACSVCGADPGVPLAKAGDVFISGPELFHIVTKIDPHTWVVDRGYAGSAATSHSATDVVAAHCMFGATVLMWKFLDDPHGTGSGIIVDTPFSAFSGHTDATTGQQITEAGDGLAVRACPKPAGSCTNLTLINQPMTANLPSQYSFAGKNANGFGNAERKHPANGDPDSEYVYDWPAWDFVGNGGGTNVWVNVSGQLYKSTSNLPAIAPKHYAIAGKIGAIFTTPSVKSILDVSGPSVTLGTTSADSYKMCIPNVNGECHSGSVVGEVYVNVPGTIPLVCDHKEDLCVANYSRYANGCAQIGLDGVSGRVIGQLPLGLVNDYPTCKPVDSTQALDTMGSATVAESAHAPSNVVAITLTPFTAQDAKDRSTFLRATLPTVVPPAGTVTAAVEFGYVEQGAALQYFCTSRREKCVVVSSTVTDATPYWFESTDFAASRYTRIPCTVSCTATLPVLPSHTAFYQWVFYDSGGAPITTTGYNGIAVEDTVK